MKRLLIIAMLLVSCSAARAQEMTASWYSVESLKAEGSWKKWKGVTKSGEVFVDSRDTAACNLYPLGSCLRVTSLDSGRSVVVRVNDRIAKRFGRTRIDLSRGAFLKIGELRRGIERVTVEAI